ncbi:hypothetical protein F2Q69_00006115 [Brassica cretica]|uniref:Uncharacterized protein n=1 Tax=Brassica cretica TaxID=69181 RepID=A0A8S9NZJ0_BRACR|nr:hypothetical protein F2Q69_00006115 [Brassica cretica]
MPLSLLKLTNNYQQKPSYINQQSSYPPKPNYHSPQGQAGSSSPQGISTDIALKQILESQSRQEKTIGDLLKKLHTRLMEITLTSTINSPTSPQASNHWDLYRDITAESQRAATEIVAKAEVHIVEKADDKVVERVEIQAVKKVEEKVVKRVGHKAETSINENTGQKLKEVELEETPKVEQPPYDKLSFPGRFITKSPNKVIYKFRTYMSDVGVKLPEITNMHDAYVQMMFIKYILSNQEEVAELLDISTSKIDPLRSELAVKPRSREKWRHHKKTLLIPTDLPTDTKVVGHLRRNTDKFPTKSKKMKSSEFRRPFPTEFRRHTVRRNFPTTFRRHSDKKCNRCSRRKFVGIFRRNSDDIPINSKVVGIPSVFSDGIPTNHVTVADKYI